MIEGASFVEGVIHQVTHLLSDLLPNNSRHFISIKLDDGILDDNLVLCMPPSDPPQFRRDHANGVGSERVTKTSYQKTTEVSKLATWLQYE